MLFSELVSDPAPISLNVLIRNVLMSEDKVEEKKERESLKEIPHTERKREHGPMRKAQIYSKEEVICSANSLTFVEVETRKPLVKEMEVLIENDEMNQTETVEAVYKWKKEGNRIVYSIEYLHALWSCKIYLSLSLHV